MKTIIAANIKPWSKVGVPEQLAKLFGAYLQKQVFRDPDGQEHDFSLFGGRNFAIVCAITTEGKLILVRQYKQGVHDIVIEFSAGTAEEGENLELTATRELEEETGFRAGRMLKLHRHHISTRKSPSFFRVFLALDCSFTGKRRLDADETIEVLEAEPQEFWDLVRTGQITEPSTLTAALHATLAGYLPISRSR
ncbi:MAG: NUDIX hydrolase [bacterium]|nr:NUDIX hydrolase [bacterium]MDZ4343108.1 NUDIX hydrolase [Candidatus Binatia bacterium]